MGNFRAVFRGNYQHAFSVLDNVREKESKYTVFCVADEASVRSTARKKRFERGKELRRRRARSSLPRSKRFLRAFSDSPRFDATHVERAEVTKIHENT